MRNTGSKSNDVTVICQDRVSIVRATSSKLSKLLTTPESVDVKACCAPITSEFKREISAPVCVLVKKAIDYFCTCSKTLVRKSKINPSPIFAENHLPTMLNNASKIAMTATKIESCVTNLES